MKKIFLSFCLLPLLFLSAYTTTLQEAEQFYREGKYAASLGAYEDLLHTYPNDPFLYYNVGNCYFKMGSRGLAVANYYRAFRLAPRDKDIRHNLSLALNGAGEKFIPVGMPAVLHQTFFSLTVEELRGLFYLSLWLFCAAAIIWLLKRKLLYLTGIFLLSTLVLGSWYVWRWQIRQEPLAVVAAPMAELRSGPGDNFPASASVSQGHLLILQDSKDHWYEVVVKSQGLKGWIEKDTLEKI